MVRTRPVPGSIDTTAPCWPPQVFSLITFLAIFCQLALRLLRMVRPPTSSCSGLSTLGSSWATQLVK